MYMGGNFSTLSVRTSSEALAGEALNVVASPDRILGWAEIAQPGDQFVYASRAYLPSGSEGAKAAYDLATRGLVHLKQRRIAGSIATNYVAERTSAAWKPKQPKLPRSAPPAIRSADAEAAAINALLPVLQRAARFGRPCPTDAQLATRCGLSRGDVKAAIAAMELMNMVRVIAVKAPTLRMVTIVSTGHRTGLVAA